MVCGLQGAIALLRQQRRQFAPAASPSGPPCAEQAWNYGGAPDSAGQATHTADATVRRLRAKHQSPRIDRVRVATLPELRPAAQLSRRCTESLAETAIEIGSFIEPAGVGDLVDLETIISAIFQYAAQELSAFTSRH
jgi:hypothetical protein